MKNPILTIITYDICDDILQEDFKDFLEKTCHAHKVADQSTYVSSLNREEIAFQINLKPFVFGNDDHVTLYYCPGRNTNSSLPLTEYAVVDNKR